MKQTPKKFNHIHERNKDNLWFINKYLKSSFMYSYSIINNMFTIIDIDKFENINTNNGKSKNEKFENLIYRIKKNIKKTKTNKDRELYILDKESNIVYHNNKYYGKYDIKHIEKSHQFYDKTKIIKSIYIYNNEKELKYIVYPQIQKYEKIQNVFDDFESITTKENNALAHKLDKELGNLKIMMKERLNTNCEEKEEILKQYDIKNKIVKIINELYYSNLDLKQNMYDLINNYLYNIENKTEEIYKNIENNQNKLSNLI